MSRPVKYSALGSRPRDREKYWWRDRPDELVELHSRLRDLDLSGDLEGYRACCVEVETMLVERGELIYRG